MLHSSLRNITALAKQFLWTDKVDRPSYQDYFLFLAEVISTRSIDAQTQVGAVLVNEHNHILATGYNSYARGMPDEYMPNIRPYKYDKILHAEQSMLVNAAGSYWQFETTAYTTIRPCYQCLSLMVNANVKNIFCIKKNVSKETEKNQEFFDLLLETSGINYQEVEPDYKIIIERLTRKGVL